MSCTLTAPTMYKYVLFEYHSHRLLDYGIHKFLGSVSVNIRQAL